MRVIAYTFDANVDCPGCSQSGQSNCTAFVGDRDEHSTPPSHRLLGKANSPDLFDGRTIARSVLWRQSRTDHCGLAATQRAASVKPKNASPSAGVCYIRHERKKVNMKILTIAISWIDDEGPQEKTTRVALTARAVGQLEKVGVNLIPYCEETLPNELEAMIAQGQDGQIVVRSQLKTWATPGQKYTIQVIDQEDFSTEASLLLFADVKTRDDYAEGPRYVRQPFAQKEVERLFDLRALVRSENLAEVVQNENPEWLGCDDFRCDTEELTVAWHGCWLSCFHKHSNVASESSSFEQWDLLRPMLAGERELNLVESIEALREVLADRAHTPELEANSA